ncbi:Uncharacterised protein [Vibrio cholerae]|nr:Uncharacterised protein [Vibrio cholerae]
MRDFRLQTLTKAAFITDHSQTQIVFMQFLNFG